MSDLIDRQAVLDGKMVAVISGQAINVVPVSYIKTLTCAQPEQQHGRIFQEIVVEYPSCNIYPEYIGKPYFSIKYTENGQEFIGYGTYSPEVLSEYLKEYFMPSAQPEQRWIPCSERLPEYGKTVLWCNDKGSVFTTAITYKNGDSWAIGKRHRRCQVVAWMPLPEPYQGGENDEND